MVVQGWCSHIEKRRGEEPPEKSNGIPVVVRVEPESLSATRFASPPGMPIMDDLSCALFCIREIWSLLVVMNVVTKKNAADKNVFNSFKSKLGSDLLNCEDPVRPQKSARKASVEEASRDAFAVAKKLHAVQMINASAWARPRRDILDECSFVAQLFGSSIFKHYAEIKEVLRTDPFSIMCTDIGEPLWTGHVEEIHLPRRKMFWRITHDMLTVSLRSPHSMILVKSLRDHLEGASESEAASIALTFSMFCDSFVSFIQQKRRPTLRDIIEDITEVCGLGALEAAMPVICRKFAFWKTSRHQGQVSPQDTLSLMRSEPSNAIVVKSSVYDLFMSVCTSLSPEV